MGLSVKSIFGYLLVFIVAFLVSNFYYQKVLNDPQIIRIFELEMVSKNI